MLISGSCQDLEKTERPADLIPESKMVDVLTELSLVYAARNYNKQKLEATGIKPDEYIFEKFDIDSLQFERSNDYYSEQYSQYERIYDSVKSRIQKMKNRLDSLRDIEVKREDSIKQVEKDSIQALDSLGRNPRKIDTTRMNKFKKIRKQRRDSLISPPVSIDKKS